MVQEISHVNSQNKYIIPNHQNSKGKRELNMYANIKTKNSKNLKVKVLVDSGCTHIGIDKQLVKEREYKQNQLTSYLKFSMWIEQKTER